MKRALTAVFVVVACASCGDANGISSYPDVLGTYDASIQITLQTLPNGATQTLPACVGEITVQSQQDDVASGTFAIFLGDYCRAVSGAFAGSVGKNGDLSFDLAPTGAQSDLFLSLTSGNCTVTTSDSRFIGTYEDGEIRASAHADMSCTPGSPFRAWLIIFGTRR